MNHWPFSDKLLKAITEINGNSILVYEGYDFSLLEDICANFFSRGIRQGNSWYPPHSNKIDLMVEDYDGTFEEWEQEVLNRLFTKECKNES